MKFDSNLIPGFGEMTADEKVEALLNFEIETPKADESEETRRLKLALSKANSEASEWKKALREKQTEAERAEAERAEREKAVEEELRGLRREKTVSKRMAKCLALGYDETTAESMANATANLTDEEADAIFNGQATFLESKKKEYEAAALNKQPTITSGSPPTAKTAEADAYNKMRAAWGLKPIK